ncbi:hypothetical protein GS498_25255 [Rhodococcus hoagii]|nr:hypothetical protein [Prescottella equi]
MTVDKEWVVDGVTYREGSQPDGLDAMLTLSDRRRTADGAVVGRPRGGYDLADSPASDPVDETTTITDEACVLDDSRVTERNGTAVDADLPYSDDLAGLSNTYLVTNTVSCEAEPPGGSLGSLGVGSLGSLGVGSLGSRAWAPSVRWKAVRWTWARSAQAPSVRSVRSVRWAPRCSRLRRLRRTGDPSRAAGPAGACSDPDSAAVDQHSAAARHVDSHPHTSTALEWPASECDRRRAAERHTVRNLGITAAGLVLLGLAGAGAVAIARRRSS